METAAEKPSEDERRLEESKQQLREQGSRNWSSDLPDPVIHSIAKRLTNLVDFYSLCAVCREWRPAAKAAEREFLASHPPLLWLGIGDTAPSTPSRMYSSPDNRFIYDRNDAKQLEYRSDGRCVGSYHGHFILLFNFIKRHGRIVDPLTGAVLWDFSEAPNYFYRASLTAHPASPDCIMVAIRHNLMQYYRPRHRDWTVVFHRPEEPSGTDWSVTCTAVLDGRVYALTRNGRNLITFQLPPSPDPACSQLEGLVGLPLGSLVFRSLVESEGEILAVCSFHNFAPMPGAMIERFEIYRLDLQARKWTRVETLGDHRSLFVNYYNNPTMFVLGGDNRPGAAGRGGGGFAGNCVYFISNGADEECYRQNCYPPENMYGTLNVFRLKDGEIDTLATFESHIPLYAFHWIVPGAPRQLP